MTGHRQPWYLDRLRAELERVAAIEDRRERGPALGRLRPALGRLRPAPHALVALALVAALVAVVLTVARESDVERPAAPPGQKVVPTDVPRGLWCRLDDQTPSLVAFVRLPSASPGASGQITETANNWTRLFASSAQLCNAYTVCEHVIRPSKKEWRLAAGH